MSAGSNERSSGPPKHQEIDAGGLRFRVYRNGERGRTIEVYGPRDGAWVEMLRFDDFMADPHFHVPAHGPQIKFDRSHGEPQLWFLEQIRSQLATHLVEGGFSDVLSQVDLEAAAGAVGAIEQALEASAPFGTERVPGFGLKRVDS